MLDTGRHSIRVTDTVSLWRPTLFLFLAAVILASSTSSLCISIISMVESEHCGKKKWQQWSLVQWSHHFLAKSSPRHKTRVKMSLLKLNLFFFFFFCVYIYIYWPHREKKRWVMGALERKLHAEIYIMVHQTNHAFFCCCQCCFVVVIFGGYLTWKISPPPPTPLSF